MTTYYKATRPDGRDFRTGDLITTEQYATLTRPFVDAGLGELVA